MATNIGRVEFLVGLDGSRLPAQARQIARQMEAAGTRAGNDFGDNFEASFERTLSRVGRNFSERLSAQGRLAARRFSTDFENIVSGRFQRMQTRLAEIISDRDTFLEFARGFDDVGDAVRQLEADLDSLVGQQVEWVDQNGEVQRSAVLARGEYQRFGAAIREFGREAEVVIRRERELATEQERLDADFRRLIRTVGDTDAFREMSRQVGGTGDAFHVLRTEIVATGHALGRSQGDIEEWVDRLDKTRQAVDRADLQMRELERRPPLLERAFRRLGTVMAKPFTALDKDVRLVIGLIASAADQVAVLGSALGAGLIAVGGAAAQGIVGVAGLAAVISRLSGDVSGLPDDLKPVVRAFNDFKESFGGLVDVIAEAAFAEMGGVFESFGDTVRGLEPVFSRLGTSVGNVFRDLAIAIRPGTEAFGELEELVDNSAGGFEAMMGTVGKLGLALVRSFNRAQPLVQDLLGWVDRLVTRFDDFTQSRGFDDWVSNAQRVFGSLGRLLDQLGRSLNNLATPEAVGRTTALLDNLSDFLPVLTGMLDILGRLDPLGLIVDALNRIGEAVSPLIAPLGRLADALNVQLTAAITGVAAVLTPLANALVPVVEAFALLIRVIPPPVVSALAGSLTALAASIGALNAATALGGLAKKLEGATGWMSKLAGPTDKLSGGMSRLGRALGVGGVLVTGILALVEGIVQLGREMSNVEDDARNLVANNATLASSFTKLNTTVEGFPRSIEDWGPALSRLNEVGPVFNNIGLAFDQAGAQALALSGTLKELDAPLAQLPLEAATAQFAAYATEIGASDDQVLAMLNSMPQLKQRLIEASGATGDLATDQELVAAAMESASGGTEENISTLEKLQTQAELTGDEVETLADQIKGFGQTSLDTRDANRQFEVALADLRGKLEENGVTVDASTKKGRENQAAIDDLIESTNAYAGSIFETTQDQDAANAALATGKQRLLDMLTRFDAAGVAAGEYNDYLDDIPDDIATVIKANTKPAVKSIDNLISTYNSKTITIGVVGKPGGFTAMGSGGIVGMKAGGILAGPRIILAGEDRAEAIVPLDRPLSRVDPSVRALSAVAQGFVTPSAPTVSAGNSRIVNVEQGAIQITAPDPWRAATETLNALTARAVG